VAGVSEWLRRGLETRDCDRATAAMAGGERSPCPNFSKSDADYFGGAMSAGDLFGIIRHGQTGADFDKDRLSMTAFGLKVTARFKKDKPARCWVYYGVVCVALLRVHRVKGLFMFSSRMIFLRKKLKTPSTRKTRRMGIKGGIRGMSMNATGLGFDKGALWVLGLCGLPFLVTLKPAERGGG